MSLDYEIQKKASAMDAFLYVLWSTIDDMKGIYCLFKILHTLLDLDPISVCCLY